RWTVRASRSTFVFALNFRAPNTGVWLAGGCTDTAACAAMVKPSQLSSWGWKTVYFAPSCSMVFGHGSGLPGMAPPRLVGEGCELAQPVTARASRQRAATDRFIRRVLARPWGRRRRRLLRPLVDGLGVRFVVPLGHRDRASSARRPCSTWRQ